MVALVAFERSVRHEGASAATFAKELRKLEQARAQWACIPIRTSQLRLVQRTVEAEHGTLILCVCQYITKLSQWVLMVS